jgi:histidine triad (HIT) family protein
MEDCVFCKIGKHEAPATYVREWDDAVAIRPRGGGVNDSHVLVIPKYHVEDAGQLPSITGMTMARAAEIMGEYPAANIITSKGVAATQSVFHLHVHVISRTEGDGLLLPWSTK